MDYLYSEYQAFIDAGIPIPLSRNYRNSCLERKNDPWSANTLQQLFFNFFKNRYI